MKRNVKLKINGETFEVAIDPWKTLLEVLREELSLFGTKQGCDTGDCGACTVLMDGKNVLSCLLLAAEAEGKEIVTIEGLAQPDALHPVQQAFIESGAIQCGFCTPGMIMTAKALLDENPTPGVEEIKLGISGNLCRCTGYVKIMEAIASAAGKTRT